MFRCFILSDRPVRRDGRRRCPVSGARSMRRRLRMRPAACSTASRARRRFAACSTMGRAFRRLTIRTARTCNSRSKACRRRTRPRNTANRTTISIRSATCLRRCDPAGRRRLTTPRGRACRCRCASASSDRARSSPRPRVTYATAGVPADTRAAYLKAINASLTACMPLKFTGGLGGALAGRPIAIRYVDNRDLAGRRGSRDAGAAWRIALRAP